MHARENPNLDDTNYGSVPSMFHLTQVASAAN
jgi:hypothetical protein